MAFSMYNCTHTTESTAAVTRIEIAGGRKMPVPKWWMDMLYALVDYLEECHPDTGCLSKFMVVKMPGILLGMTEPCAVCAPYIQGDVFQFMELLREEIAQAIAKVCDRSPCLT